MDCLNSRTTYAYSCRDHNILTVFTMGPSYNEKRIALFRKALAGGGAPMKVAEILLAKLQELPDGSVCSISNGRPLTADKRGECSESDVFILYQ